MMEGWDDGILCVNYCPLLLYLLNALNQLP